MATRQDVTLRSVGPYAIKYSLGADRSAAEDLSGAALAGQVHVFVDPPTGVESVKWYRREGEDHTREDSAAPFDLIGGTEGAASPWTPLDDFAPDDIGDVVGEGYVVAAVLTCTDGGVRTIQASFRVLAGASVSAALDVSVTIGTPTIVLQETGASGATVAPSTIAVPVGVGAAVLDDLNPLDLQDYEAGEIPYTGEYPHPVPSGVSEADHAFATGTLQFVTVNNTERLRVTVWGPKSTTANPQPNSNDSRNGAWLRYPPEVIGEWTDLYVAHKFRLLPDFVWSIPEKKGDIGKLGLRIDATLRGTPYNSGGGLFFQDASSCRTIISRYGDATSQVGQVKTYNYLPRSTGKWFEWEGAYFFGGSTPGTGVGEPPITHGMTSAPRTEHPAPASYGLVAECDWNHWENGGNRGKNTTNVEHETTTQGYGKPKYPGASVRPLWTYWRNSRYVGRTSQMIPSGQSVPFTFTIGDVIDLEIHVQMNTFSTTSTVDTGAWMGVVNRPNANGIYRVRVSKNGAAPIIIRNTTDCVWRYPCAPNLTFNQFAVGGAAGGPYEGADGQFEVWDVRFRAREIL